MDYKTMNMSDIYDVGDKVTSRFEVDKDGKISAVFIDPVLQKQIISVDWDDKTTSVVLSDWISKQDMYSLWIPWEEKAKGDKDVVFGLVHTKEKDELRGQFADAKDHIETVDVADDAVITKYKKYSSLKENSVEISDYTLDKILPFLTIKLASTLKLKENEVEEFLKVSEYKILEDGQRILIEKGNKSIVASIEDGEVNNVEYYKDMEQVNSKEFLNDIDKSTMILASTDDGYTIDWNGEKLLMSKDEFVDFCRDYSLDKKRIFASFDGGSKVKIII